MEEDGGVRLLLKNPLNNRMRCAGLRAGMWGLQQALCYGSGAIDAVPNTTTGDTMVSRGSCSTVKDRGAVLWGGVLTCGGVEHCWLILTWQSVQSITVVQGFVCGKSMQQLERL